MRCEICGREKADVLETTIIEQVGKFLHVTETRKIALCEQCEEREYNSCEACGRPCEWEVPFLDGMCPLCAEKSNNE